MDKTQLIAYLRQNCIVQDPEVLPNDPVFLALTDEQLELVLEVALSKESPSDDLDNLPSEVVYPLILVAKKELYFQLASKTAPLYPIGFGDSSIKKNTRFDHYMTLIKQTETEYQNFKNTGQPIIAGDILLANRYYSKRNYERQAPPTVVLNLDAVYSNKVELSWTPSKVKRFYNYLLYKSAEQIVDLYSQESLKVYPTAEQIVDIRDLHSNRYRIEGLQSSTLYHVAVIVQEDNGLKGYSEITFTTLL
jgi:hypothetical protein